MVWFAGLFFSVVPAGCGDHRGDADEGEQSPVISGASQGLSSDPRTRMVQEASYAMWGNHYAYDAMNWPEGTRYATHAYTNQDRGAWDKLMRAAAYGSGSMVSCKGNFSPCYLSYGADQMPYYTCQGYCPASVYRGGQCKAFTNLVAYRSGVYQNPYYAFREFPHDSKIENQPFAVHGTLKPGDILRRTTATGSPHSVIVVRRLSWPRIIVVDSNWVGGPGREIVGSHEMRFDDQTPVGNPGTYRVMNCVYDKSC